MADIHDLVCPISTSIAFSDSLNLCRAANTIRAWRPQELQDPMVAFSIFSSVTITRGGMFTTLSEGLSFVSRLLKGFMLGFAIATGVSLLILPITSRGHVFDDIRGYVAQIDNVLQSQIDFVKGTSEVWTGGQGLLKRTRTARSMRDMQNSPSSDLEAKQKRLTASITKLNGLHGKLQSDLLYSKDEIAWGKLSAGDLSRIGGLLRSVLLPLSGMAMLPEVLDMIVRNEGTRNNSVRSLDAEEDSVKQSEMQKVAQTLQDRLVDSSRLATVGLQYVLLALGLSKRKKIEKQYSGKADEEGTGELLTPLEPQFAQRFEQEMRNYFSRRKDLTRNLASLEAFTVLEKPDDATSQEDMAAIATDPDVKQEFFLILFMGHLQDNLLTATLDLIRFADDRIQDGTMKRSRLILPRLNTIRKWLSLNTDHDTKSAPDRRQSSHVDPAALGQTEANNFPDPEHLPPANWFEKSSLALRYLSHIIRSEQSIFGFRVAAAAFSVGILAYLRKTQDFFTHQRCIWAMIVIVIGMNPTSGQTMFGFVARIVATAVSLVLSLIVWYIVDEKTPGVIVFLYLANVFEVSQHPLHTSHLLTPPTVLLLRQSPAILRSLRDRHRHSKRHCRLRATSKNPSRIPSKQPTLTQPGPQTRHRSRHLQRPTLLPNLPLRPIQTRRRRRRLRHLLLLGHLPLPHNRQNHPPQDPGTRTLRPRQVLQLHAHDHRALAHRRTRHHHRRWRHPLRILHTPTHPPQSLQRRNAPPQQPPHAQPLQFLRTSYRWEIPPCNLR